MIPVQFDHLAFNGDQLVLTLIAGRCEVVHEVAKEVVELNKENRFNLI